MKDYLIDFYYLTVAKYKRIILCTIVNFVMMALMSLIGLVFAYAIPYSLTYWNILDSEKTLMREGEYPSLWGIDFLKKDNFTDGTMYNLMSSAGASLEVVDNLLLNPRLADPEGVMSPAEAGYKSMTAGNENLITWNYGRYWHGYLLPLRVFSVYMPLSDLRIVNQVLLWVLFAVSVSLMWWKVGWKEALCFFAACMAVCFPSVPYSLQFSTCFYLMFSGVIMVLWGENYVCFRDFAYMFFFLLGGLTSYFDLLTTPVITLGIPLTVLMLNDSYKDNVRFVLAVSLFWALGYFGLWGAKWVIATLVTGENVLSDAIHSASVHTEHGFGDSDVVNGRMIILAFAIIGLVVGMIVLYAKKYGFKSKAGKGILCVYFLPVVWYLLLWGHSSVHLWFTWRSLIVSVFCGLILLTDGKRLRKPSFLDEYLAQYEK